MRSLLLIIFAATIVHAAAEQDKVLHFAVVTDVCGETDEYVGDMAQAEFDEMNGGTKKFVTLHNVFRFDEDDGLRHPLSETSGNGRLYGYKDVMIIPIMRILEIIPVDPEKIGTAAPKSDKQFQ